MSILLDEQKVRRILDSIYPGLSKDAVLYPVQDDFISYTWADNTYYLKPYEYDIDGERGTVFMTSVWTNGDDGKRQQRVFFRFYEPEQW